MADASSAQQHWGIAPYFLVDDVVGTAHFYRDKLGFRFDRFWGEPPAFCMVRRGGITIMLSQPARKGLVRPNNVALPNDGAWDAYVWVVDADALYTEFEGRGVIIARNLCDQAYGCRDFDVLDCNGYRLCFGQDISR